MSSELFFRLDAGQSAGGAGLTLKPIARARAMRLRVDPRNGAVVLTYPARMSKRRVLDWAGEHRGWVEAQLAGIPKQVPVEPGTCVPLHGEPHRIDWGLDHPRVPAYESGRIIVGGPRDTLEPRLLRWLKQHAARVLARETQDYAAKAGVTVTRVAVGDPLSRWGSCSSSGAIRYSWRLILAPDWVRRATVAHEVAHRVHMNHGPDFHALVETLLGTDPKPARLWLRHEGAGLHRFFRLG